MLSLTKLIQFSNFYKRFNIISLILIILSVFILIFKGLNFGVDFKGGTLIELRTNDSVKISSELEEIYNLFENTEKGSGEHLKKFLDSAKSNYETESCNVNLKQGYRNFVKFVLLYM